MIGFLAYSLAGHDKGEIYLILDETKDYVYVADGLARPIDRPKKKNKRHIQVIKKIDRNADISSITNEDIKHIIKLYYKKQRTASYNQLNGAEGQPRLAEGKTTSAK